MPPLRQSPSHSRSLSPYSRTPSRNEGNLGPLIDAYQYAELIHDPEDYDRVQVELFGRYDLMMKTIMFKHVYETIGQLRKELQRQWTVATSLFDEMANSGLHQELGDMGREPTIPNEPEQIRVQEQEDFEQLPPYRRTPSPDVPLIHPTPQRSTPLVDICFPLIPVTPLEEVCERMTRYEISNSEGSRQNPILIIEEDDEDNNEDDSTEDEFATPSSDIFCYHCHHCGHVYYDCDTYQCDNCYVYAPGHPISDCYYAHH